VNVLEFSLLLTMGSTTAGLLGALTGLGGGVVIVPLLTLLFNVDLRYAIGASMVSVIATSSGAAAAYVRDGITNIRIGMFLEIATTIGSLGGAFISLLLPSWAIMVIFGVVLLYSAYVSTREPPPSRPDERGDPLAARLGFNGSYPSPAGPKPYRVHGVALGFSLAWLSGTLAGLLGIGAGALKVVTMDQVMRIPFKVSTATSNFMIGVTAAAGVGVYLREGYIDPGLAMPVMLGVTLGSWLGARILLIVRPHVLRVLFSAVILLLGLEMIRDGWLGRH
jgi:uncharacterized membrane protein YfcA